MEYRNVGGKLETEETIVSVRRHDLRDLKDRKSQIQSEIDHLQLQKEDVQLLINEAKKVGLE
jgi:hypothetical protein